jgi:hypothetical protein
MKLQTLAIAAALTAAAASSAFAMERTVVRETPNGTVVKHVERYDHGDRDYRRVRVIRHESPRMERVRVVRRVVWTDHHGNRHIRKVITWRMVPMHTAERVVVRHYG